MKPVADSLALDGTASVTGGGSSPPPQALRKAVAKIIAAQDFFVML